MNTGEKIRYYRKRTKLTQKQLAEKTGISLGAIQGYEQGSYSPKAEQAAKIASALHVPLQEILAIKTYETAKQPSLEERIERAKAKIAEHADVDKIIRDYLMLNQHGKEKAAELVKMLTKIPEYQKTEESED